MYKLPFAAGAGLLTAQLNMFRGIYFILRWICGMPCPGCRTALSFWLLPDWMLDSVGAPHCLILFRGCSHQCWDVSVSLPSRFLLCALIPGCFFRGICRGSVLWGRWERIDRDSDGWGSCVGECWEQWLLLLVAVSFQWVMWGVLLLLHWRLPSSCSLWVVSGDHLLSFFSSCQHLQDNVKYITTS